MEKKKLTIGVTGLNAIDSPGPGVAVIRGLRESDDFSVRIIGLSYESLEPGIYMEGVCDKVYQIPYPGAGSEALLERLRYIQERENLDVIIPNFDAELPNFIKISSVLRTMKIHTFLPTVEQFESRDKLNLHAFGKKHGFLVPEDRTLFSSDELKAAGDALGYPIVVKGKFYEAVIAQTLEQAQKAFYKMQAKWGLPVIAQQFIAGTEVNIAALGDGKGNTISAVPMRKMYITDKGKAWAGITIEEPILTKLAEKFIETTKWAGGFELEIMLTQDNKPFIMEINPRFPAWIHLTTGSGQNQPAALALLAMGETVEPFTEYTVGKMFIRYSWDLITDVTEFQKISAFGEI
jgi:carbamoyl-phosphate synthase large subunit